MQARQLPHAEAPRGAEPRGTSIGIGLVGTGFMGAAHAMAFRTAPAVFETALKPRLAAVADISLDAAQAAAARFDFAQAYDDWRALVADPAVELVAIATPNAVHRDVAVAALA